MIRLVGAGWYAVWHRHSMRVHLADKCLDKSFVLVRPGQLIQNILRITDDDIVILKYFIRKRILKLTKNPNRNLVLSWKKSQIPLNRQ